MAKRDNPQYIDPNVAVPDAAILAANAFYENAHQFISAGPLSSESFDQYTKHNVGGLIASATNLALALELYMKGIMLRLNVRAPHTHDLADLFDGLPDDIQRRVVQRYGQLLKAKVSGKQSMEVTLLAYRAESPRQESGLPMAQITMPRDVVSVLERAKDAFVSWRYFFESVDPQEGKELCYEHGYLLLIAQSLRAQWDAFS